MKKIIYLFSALLLTGFVANADSIIEASSDSHITNYRNYGKSFIFEEDGIEFSVFPDGQFDFNIRRYCSDVDLNVNIGGVSINYNSGYDYSAYLQYDEFGAIIQIENTWIDYDYYGRVSQIGDVRIRYNRNRVSRIGGLRIFFNNYGRFDYCTGFINMYNRAYVYRPWHRFYILPPVNYCVVYNRPYRQFYTPIRYRYDRPYVNNYRRTTAVASRRGNRVVRNRSYASNTNGRSRATTRTRSRGTATQATPRTRGTRGNTNATTRTRGTRGNASTTTRTRTRDNATRSNTRTRTRTNSPSSTPRTRSTTPQRTRTKTQVRHTRSERTVSKPNRTRTQTRTTRSNTKKRASSSSNRSQRPSARTSQKRNSAPKARSSKKSNSRAKSSRTPSTRSKSSSRGKRSRRG